METLEVIGRRSGKIVSLPVVVAVVDGERYLVSMLGDDVQWCTTCVQPAAKPHCAAPAWSRSGSTTCRRNDVLPYSRNICAAHRGAGRTCRWTRRAARGVRVDRRGVSGVSNRRAERANDVSGRAPALFVVLTFLLSIPLWIVGAETGWQIIGGLPVSALAAFCPAVVAALLVYRRGGTAGVGALLERTSTSNGFATRYGMRRSCC
jgi:hypothetical protein